MGEGARPCSAEAKGPCSAEARLRLREGERAGEGSSATRLENFHHHVIEPSVAIIVDDANNSAALSLKQADLALIIGNLD